MEQRFTRDDNVVEQRFPREAANVLPGVIGRAAAGEQDETMEPGLPPTVEHKLPRVVERALLMAETGESYTPLRDAEDELQRLNSAGMIEHRLSSITLHVRPVVAVGAIRGDPVPYHESQPGPSPKSTVAWSAMPRMIRHPCKHFLHDLKHGEIEQMCMIAPDESATIAAVTTSDVSARPQGAEPKSAREARYAVQSLRTLQSRSVLIGWNVAWISWSGRTPSCGVS
ncbi:hypothetical protein L914_21844 [Phytophthora nicotianae]|uniref:Uncharacterized protein n=1 Tax=Phytophthora nicotianae TaxID=4792 RepID=W2M2D7_PHYNI|nr:hypothetical protein L914_21844 [Phytophthora nicotianae]